MSVGKAFVLALFGLLLAQPLAKLWAQESLGDTARRIRAGKGDATPTVKPGSAPAVLSPSAADLTATVNLIAETDPEKYSAGIRELLEQDKFRVLDDISAGERVNKTRFSGGEWKLHTFYEALASPANNGRGVVADWNAYRDRLNRWVAQQPASITARVALADAELMYAWQLRSTSDVNPESHRLFAERVKLAETILNQASDLPLKCPQWFNVMQQAGRAAGWTADDLSTLLQRAIAVEPQYYYVYQQHALTLTAKWQGKEGDAEKFAEESANKIGGKPGNILYWQIAQSIIGNRDLGNIPQHFSWSRALIGYQALVEQYGASLLRQNQNAMMAAKFGDYMTADDGFLQIGDHWDQGTWGTKEYFDKVKTWARGSAGPFKKIVEAYQAVNVNIGTPEGQRYDGQIAREFSAHFAGAVRDCATSSNGPAPTLLIMQVSKTGVVQQMLVVPETASDACLRPKLEKAWFSPPPKPEYWVRVSLNKP
ncbi:MAG: hypothetical protein WA738_05445 [Candidatus Angelobacter sp.]